MVKQYYKKLKSNVAKANECFFNIILINENIFYSFQAIS